MLRASRLSSALPDVRHVPPFCFSPFCFLASGEAGTAEAPSAERVQHLEDVHEDVQLADKGAVHQPILDESRLGRRLSSAMGACQGSRTAEPSRASRATISCGLAVLPEAISSSAPL